MSEANASAGIGTPDTVDTDTEESTWKDGLDDDALNETGADLGLGIFGGAVGVAAWALPGQWLVAMFIVGGIGIMFAEDRRIRVVGPLITAASLASMTSGVAASIVAGVLFAVVGALYHHKLVDVGEVI